MTTETRARVHVILGRLIQALQYAKLSELTGHLTPSVPLATSAALATVAANVPLDGRNAFLRKACGFLADAYYAIDKGAENKAIIEADKADGLITAFLNPAGKHT